jgi:hypothetical protein
MDSGIISFIKSLCFCKDNLNFKSMQLPDIKGESGWNYQGGYGSGFVLVHIAKLRAHGA